MKAFAAAVGVFFAAMVFCLASGHALAWALGIGLAAVFLAGLARGFDAKALARMAAAKLPETMTVLRIIFFIGILTGLWRSCGTISFFIFYGVRAITPRLFVLLAFLLTALLSYALGTSFGVTSTAGVVLIALARSGGVHPAVAAGAILSGVYFGDRGAPTSSCASLVAAITGTELYQNVRRMHRTALLPYLLCLVIYSFLSLRHPMGAADETLLLALKDSFVLSPWTMVPAVIMLALPLLRVPIRLAMAVSALSAFFLSVFLQGVPAAEALRVCVTGYEAKGELLGPILSGGGLVSMLTVFLMLPLASMMGGILEGAGALSGIEQRLVRLSRRIGRLPATTVVSVLCSMVLCNQTIVVIMVNQLMKGIYRRDGASGEELAMDIANSGVTLAGLVPWCIACAVPLSMLGVGVEALPFAALLYLIPFCYLFTKNKFYPKGAA